MFRDAFIGQRPQIVVLLGLSVGIVALTTVAYGLERQLFNRFLGRINPILASAIIVLVGGLILTFFVAREWFAIYTPISPERFLWPAALAIVLAGGMILVDSRIVMAEDINAPFPYSILYYPVVGYAAEILFHVLPLFLLLAVSQTLFSGFRFDSFVWPCIVLVSLIEPVFQAQPMVGRFPAWGTAYVFLNVWVINMTGLWLFDRYDFVSMYAFRLMYYLFWHVIWGHARLGLLF